MKQKVRFLDDPIGKILLHGRTAIFEVTDAIRQMVDAPKNLIKDITLHDKQDRPDSHIGTWDGMKITNTGFGIFSLVTSVIFGILYVVGWIIALSMLIATWVKFAKATPNERKKLSLGFTNQIISFVIMCFSSVLSLLVVAISHTSAWLILLGAAGAAAFFSTWILPIASASLLALIALTIVASTIITHFAVPFFFDLKNSNAKVAWINLLKKINIFDLANTQGFVTIINNVLLCVTAIAALVLAIALGVGIVDFISVCYVICIILGFALGAAVMCGCGVKIVVTICKEQDDKAKIEKLKDMTQTAELTTLNIGNTPPNLYMLENYGYNLEMLQQNDAKLLSLNVPSAHKSEELNVEIKLKTSKDIANECFDGEKLRMKYLSTPNDDRCYGISITKQDGNHKYVIMFSEALPYVKIEPQIETAQGGGKILTGFVIKNNPLFAKNAIDAHKNELGTDQRMVQESIDWLQQYNDPSITQNYVRLKPQIQDGATTATIAITAQRPNLRFIQANNKVLGYAVTDQGGAIVKCTLFSNTKLPSNATVQLRGGNNVIECTFPAI